MKNKPPTIHFLDLRSVTRRPELCRTGIDIVDPRRREPLPWIVAGQGRLRLDARHNRVDARFRESVTDFEHDSAYAFSIPVIGVKLTEVEAHQTVIEAWIDPNDPDGFHVPLPGYDPTSLPGASRCDGGYCGDAGHPIVPSMMPPLNPDLYELVRGQRIRITIGPAYPELS